MALAYIDTNVFLDFYQSSIDRLKVFEEILARGPDVLLTDQTIEEFRRNRVARLTRLVENIENGPSAQIHATAVVQTMPGFKEWTKARDAVKKAALEIANTLSTWIANPDSDPVLVAFEKLVAVAPTIPTDEKTLERAKTRKLLGRPPTSPDKYTIGDELNWECLLKWNRGDIVIVTRDRSYIENQALLKREFSNVTGHTLVLVTKSLADGLKQVGQASGQIEQAEKKLPARREPTTSPVGSNCPMCGGQLSEEGYEGSDGDSAWWLACSKCGQIFYPPRDL